MIHNLPNYQEPTNSYHHCSYPKCTELVQGNNHYCDKHWQLRQQEYSAIKHDANNKPSSRAKRLYSQKQYNQTKRDEDANDFYHSKQWQRVRYYILQRDIYTCQICGNNYQPNHLTADHILPRKYCGDLDHQLNPENLWTLCSRCNSAKQYLERQIENKYGAKSKDEFTKITKTEWEKRVLRIERD
ncbi:HNH endonuclease signature motif containing protein [Lactobacillus sp. ESL0791]|uniref:HNH endonuclease n=1 Tax=Lactobacillus sp. ESL0791 TaxID=2983234 RepID=UPI0023F960F2|nr:HNH endonuclease signature motif containing protein [Lactobacillus sp. ESL0791]MDF7639949.1 HNH endonuclease signature motif containing protein [Lactobacillus sp. ESL0791]